MGIKRTRLDFERDFTQIPNRWMRDPKLSRRAKGLLAEITTHRAGWRITIAGLVAAGPEGRDAIVATVNELREKGYLVRSQSQGDGGRFKEVEYELCDPFTATGLSGSGAEQDTTSPDELSTGATATGFTGTGPTVSGSAATGESAPKEDDLEEHQDQEHQGGATAPPTPFCSRHPNGSHGRPCRSCGDARRLYDAALRAPAPPPPAVSRYDPDVYCEHLQLRAGHCEACEQEARTVLRSRFAVPA